MYRLAIFKQIGNLNNDSQRDLADCAEIAESRFSAMEWCDGRRYISLACERT